MLKYPIGIQTFEKIREDGFAYVDKTNLLYDLVKGGSYYFLGRPRRFGKSLLVSTLEAYFKGKKELFHGLAIENLEKDWESYPVLHFDLSKADFHERGKLDIILSTAIDSLEAEYGVKTPSVAPDVRFDVLIREVAAKTGKKVVVLVDEYDGPLVSLIDNEELLEENRAKLSGFYKNIKANDAYIKFAFLTGVTKFGHVNVFSALNNLLDISMDEKFQCICGITEEELHLNFDAGIDEMAKKQGISKEECYGKMKDMYDGYHFVAGGVGMYNPFSVLNALNSKNFGSYWFHTGTPTGLMLALRQTQQDISELNGKAVRSQSLENIFNYQTDIIPLLYQSGYLTIKGEDEDGYLVLGFPNGEVKDGFINQLLPLYSSFSDTDKDDLVRKLRRALRMGDLETFFEEMKAYLAGMYYEFFKNDEQTFQSVFYIIGSLLGNGTQPELHTNRGRIDLLIKTTDLSTCPLFPYST